ncbi:uncharacterized protein LOC135210456 [Macrobrachium nipponense]|uniref:uncharacterized protein LOC135210456 n=1 Tax=Macrobrachium nipponense TaxID=159736 RepID=UPI0030C7BF7C
MAVLLDSEKITPTKVIPVSVLCKDYISNYPQKKGLFATWTEEIHCRIIIKECLRAEATKLENQIISALTDSDVAVRMAVISTSSSSSAADHLAMMCAVTIFQGLGFLAFIIAENDSTGLRRERELLRTSIDTMRVLAEKFEIDWRKCFISICLLYVLCKTLKVTNISTQVKVITLKAMKSCIVGFIPPSMAMLMNSEKQESNSVEHMGSVLSDCLADTEWEVRDSALEVLNTCMTLAKDRYPFFAEWLIRYNLDTVVLAALEDIEGYVRASAFGVLACVVSNEKIWLKFSEENLQHRTLAAILWEGDAPVRRSAMCMVRELHAASKFSEEDLNNIVINIMQRSTEDDDDEIRLNALEFIHSHINESLQKSGMVDGEFPAVTFKGGKITKLDKHEVQKQILKIITWVCDCGYLNCLLLCANDPVTAVATKSREILVFLNNLLNKYEMKTGAHLVKRLVLTYFLKVKFIAKTGTSLPQSGIATRLCTAGCRQSRSKQVEQWIEQVKSTRVDWADNWTELLQYHQKNGTSLPAKNYSFIADLETQEPKVDEADIPAATLWTILIHILISTDQVTTHNMSLTSEIGQIYLTIAAP